MKTFLEEYGLVIIIAIVVILLIALAYVVSNTITPATQTTVNNLADFTKNAMSNAAIH